MLRKLIFGLFILAMVPLFGCGPDDPEVPGKIGTVKINPSPDSINAPWSLSGPEDRSGEGDETYSDLKVGSYTISWGDVQGWTSPSGSTIELKDTGTITFDNVSLVSEGLGDIFVVKYDPSTGVRGILQAGRDQIYCILQYLFKRCI